MSHIAVDRNGSEWIFDQKPCRSANGYWITRHICSCVRVPNGTAEKILGKKLTWDDSPAKLI